MSTYPDGLPVRYRLYWREPWRLSARNSPGFRSWLNRHGYLTPHFRISESRCKDGTPVPLSLRGKCRNHAFNLERLRHALGDRPIPIISWYRHPAYNARIGGARGSMHTKAIATDIPVQFVQRVGTARFDRAANGVFANGGFGQYPGGSRHVDTRGWRSRWTSW